MFYDIAALTCWYSKLLLWTKDNIVNYSAWKHYMLIKLLSIAFLPIDFLSIYIHLSYIRFFLTVELTNKNIFRGALFLLFPLFLDAK